MAGKYLGSEMVLIGMVLIVVMCWIVVMGLAVVMNLITVTVLVVDIDKMLERYVI